MIDVHAKVEKAERLAVFGYEIEGTRYLNEAWEIFRQDVGGFIFFTIILLVSSFTGKLFPYHIGQIVSFLISPGLSIGIANVARKIKYGELHTFGDFFAGFSSYKTLFVVHLISLCLTIVATMCFIIPGIYLGVAYSFAMMFAWFINDGQTFQALERSRRLITKEWWSFFGFMILLGLFVFLGVICFLFGVLVTIPVSGIAMFLCFDELIGTEDEAYVAETEDEEQVAESAQPGQESNPGAEKENPSTSVEGFEGNNI